MATAKGKFNLAESGTMIQAQDIIEKLNLKPLPQEGGFFHETYRSSHMLAPASLDHRYPGPRSVCTAIYYLITQETFSALHRITGDEIFHFYCGDPVEMFQMDSSGTLTLQTMGNRVMEGEIPQVIVPGGFWQGLRLKPGGSWALMGTTVAPGFEFEDFEVGDRQTLAAAYPQHRQQITHFTYD